MVPPHSHGVSRVPWYSGSSSTSFAVSFTGLSPCLASLPRLFNYSYSTCIEDARTPHSRNCMVWALPLSLAATQGIDVSFSSLGYLDVSVPPVSLPQTMDSSTDMQGSPCMGFPIRTSTDQRLLAAPRGFSQLTTSFVGSRCQGIRPLLFLP